MNFSNLMIMLRLVALQYRADLCYQAEVGTTFYGSSSRGATAQTLMHLGFNTLPDPRHPVLFLEFFRATSHVAASCPVRGVCQEREGW